MPRPIDRFCRPLEQLEDRLTPTAVPYNAAFQAELEAVLREADVPQVSFAVFKGDEVFTGGATNDEFFRRYGLAVPPDPAANQLFRVASMSKFFTANAIMVLQQQGKLSVEDSALERLGFRRGDSISGKDPTDPSRDVHARLPDDLFDVTIAQLMQMLSGLPNSIPVESIASPRGEKPFEQPQDLYGSYASLAFAGPPPWAGGPATLEQGNRYYLYPTALAPRGTPTENPNYVVQPPGTRYEYNNNNFTLLGGIVEHVSGKPYFEFLTDEVLTPLGITTPLAVVPAAAERMVGVAADDLLGAYPTEVRYYQPDSGTAPSVIPNPVATVHPFFRAVDQPAVYATRSMNAALSAGGLVVTPAAAATLMHNMQQVYAGGSGVLTRASVDQMLARPAGDPTGEPADGWFGFGLVVTPDGTPGDPITWNKGGNFDGTLSSLTRSTNGTAASVIFNAEPPGLMATDPDATPLPAPKLVRELIDKYYLSARSFELVGGGGQSTVAGTGFANSVTVVVRDGLGLPVGSGVPVTFALPAGGPSAAFEGSATVMTGPGGVAVAPPLLANGLVGAYTLTAEVPGRTAATGVADLRNLPAQFLVGAGPGGGPAVRVYSTVTGQAAGRFFAFEPTFTGGVRVAVGDVNNDGFADYVAAAGPGGGPRVRVFSGRDLSVLADLFAFEPTFPGGVYVAAGDMNGDGYSDIIAGAGPGAGPRVTVFSGQGFGMLASLYAFAPTFAGGVTVGAGAGYLAVGAGPGGGPVVAVYQGLNPVPVQTYFAFAPTFADGVRVGVAEDGSVLAGAGPGGPPAFSRVAAGSSDPPTEVVAFDPSFRGGVWVS
ncbi:MAG: serine hydrolase [Gemmataceae bacterium]|nr:serine hydrolase [Gemmataceae bacterium]